MAAVFPPFNVVLSVLPEYVYDNASYKRDEAAIMTYEEIFEQEAKWMSGRHIIADILQFIKGRSLSVVIHPHHPQMVHIEVPLPTVKDEISGEQASIIFMVPEELREIFMGRISKATQAYLGKAGIATMETYIHSISTPHTKAQMQSALDNIEREREARDEGQLWKVVAKYLGVSTSLTHIQIKSFIGSY